MKHAPVVLTAPWVVAALALCACQPKAAKDPARSAEPATTVEQARLASNLDLSQPLTAHGTEPFWRLSVDGTHFRLTRPDRPDVVAEAPGAVIQAGRATWIAKAADGQQITVVFYGSDCSDGMSERQYPLTAEVVLVNESLRGCAARTSELAKPVG